MHLSRHPPTPGLTRTAVARRVLVVLMAVALGGAAATLAACGSDNAPGDATSSTAKPSTATLSTIGTTPVVTGTTTLPEATVTTPVTTTATTTATTTHDGGVSPSTGTANDGGASPTTPAVTTTPQDPNCRPGTGRGFPDKPQCEPVSGPDARGEG